MQFNFDRCSQRAGEAVELSRRLRQEEKEREEAEGPSPGTYTCPVGEETGRRCGAVVLKKNLKRHLRLHFPPQSAEVRLADGGNVSSP